MSHLNEKCHQNFANILSYHVNGHTDEGKNKLIGGRNRPPTFQKVRFTVDKWLNSLKGAFTV